MSDRDALLFAAAMKNLHAEIARLRSALEPFSWLDVPQFPASVPILANPSVNISCRNVTLADVRRAAEVLSSGVAPVPCELCGRGVDGKPHVICGECQSECSQPRKQEPA